MRSSVATRVAIALLLAMQTVSSLAKQAASDLQYAVALPGYRYEFPRDHFDHPDYQTEWWYYTGNVKSAEGHRFGFELTFFRQGVNRDTTKTNAWDVRDLYLAHLAVSDLDGGHFYHAERTNRAGPGIAGVSGGDGRIWNGNWQIQWDGDDQKLRAVDPRFELQLTLRSEKPPVVQGENGVSQKAAGSGHASHYISLTRLEANGSIVLIGKEFQVAGRAWMDHEFFTHQLEKDQIGWDWFSMQLSDNSELMLFRIRRKDGSMDPFSAGTVVDAHGRSTHLRSTDFSVQPEGETWTSPVTRATYPVRWKIAVPRLFGLELEVKTPLSAQELAGGAGTLTSSYWEGAVTYEGKWADSTVNGVGYLEMTGYDRPFEMGSSEK
ncbi:MAG: carotenoid 1,2-hydratase [Acidobacteria bacterium]|nr:carotenoid 1,2-hydratase [Acidobacteriota bacterium]